MRVYNEELTDVTRYLENHKHIKIEEKIPDFERIITEIAPYHTIGPDTKILEIGTGTGWFPIICTMRNINCKGLEISPQLVEYGKMYGRSNGVDPDIELGNIEDADLGENQYDVVIALSVFEHVEDWKSGLRKVYSALKPGGVLYFNSTNKYCPRSGEYPMLFYSWMPNWMRYRFRIMRQGPDIMKLGIDFNQFTSAMLRREFKKIGFKQIHDRLDILSPDKLRKPSKFKRIYLRISKRSKIFKYIALLFVNTTNFVCVK